MLKVYKLTYWIKIFDKISFLFYFTGLKLVVRVIDINKCKMILDNILTVFICILFFLK